MALFNYATKEITLKIVYYGPGLSGKTTNLQHLHSILNPEKKGKLLSLSTESERTLFFDFLPVELGKIREFSIRFQLYTVPGQVRYNATRKVVLKGADAVVFVADSQVEMREQNIESLHNMTENLVSNNIDPDAIPIVLQYNKRDLKNILSIEALNRDLNAAGNYEVLEATAIDGRGVEESFKRITRLLLKDISRRHKIEIPLPEEVIPASAPAEPSAKTPPGPAKAEVRPDRKPEVIASPVRETARMSEFEASFLLKDIAKKYRSEIPLPEEVFPASAPAEPSMKRPPEPLTAGASPDGKPEAAEAPMPETAGASAFEAPVLHKDISGKFVPEIPLPEEIAPPSAPLEPSPEVPQEPVREEISIDAIMNKIHDLMSDREERPEVEASIPALPHAEPEYATGPAPQLPAADEDTKPSEPAVVPLHLPETSGAGPEAVEDIFFPKAEERIEEQIPPFPEMPAAEIPEGNPASAAPFPAGTMDEFSERMRDISDRLDSMSDALSILRQTVSNLNEEIKSLRGRLAPPGVQTEQGRSSKDSQKLEDLSREQKKISELVTDIMDLLHTVKEKKSWFRF